MEFSVENICGLLMRSKLLKPEDVLSHKAKWQAETRDGGASSSQFLRWLVSRQFLSEYQANLIAKGHADDFFLNQYKIIDKLGKGRMAGVFKAVHALGQTVAIKVLPPSRAKVPQLFQRFQREARLAMKLKHPNVVRSFQVGETNGLHYLVMEHLEGETLHEVLARRSKLPPQEAVRLISQALQGLQHIHENGLVHRDLKPANLMLVPPRAPGEPDTTTNATVKVLDIGLGRELFDESTKAALDDLQLTGEGVLLGTPDYLAPEQARDARTIDIRADVYSLGCVLYHCLTGQTPFPDTNILNQMVRHATEEPKPIKAFNPAAPDALQQILSWMLAKDPNKRYPTPERAAQALQVFLVAGGEARSQDESPQMRRYLTWLETGQPDKEEPAGPPTSQVPAPAVPPPAPAVRAPMERPGRKREPGEKRPDRAGPEKRKERRTSGKSSHGGSKKNRKLKQLLARAAAGKSPPAPPATAPALAAAPALRSAQLDVELVALPPPGPAPLARRSLFADGLNLRDWAMMGLGAVAVLIALALGWLASIILG